MAYPLSTQKKNAFRAHRAFHLMLICTALLATSAHALSAQETLRVVGSSTVYPFAASVAEHVGRQPGGAAPVVESTGTGAGFKLFCAGSGARYPDITDASRQMLSSEREQCREAGVEHILEIRIGMDGITLARKNGPAPLKLTRRALFLALARQVPVGGHMVANPYARWREVDSTLPDMPIKIYGSPPVSGTRDTFVELVMEKACIDFPAFAQQWPDAATRKNACGQMREDGSFIEAGENGNLIIQKLLADPEALGIVGFSFLEENHDKVQGSFIEGHAPDFASIQNEQYPLSRSLYVYAKSDRLAANPAMALYLKEFVSEAAIGEDGYLAQQGLVPLPPQARAMVRQSVLGF